MTPQDEPRDAVPADGGTVHLGRPPEDAPLEDAPPVPENATVQLGRRSASPDATATIRFPKSAPEPVAAAEPAAVVAPTPTVMFAVPEVEASAAAAAGLIRFGPGVPDPKTARTIAVWKGAGPGPAAEAVVERPRRVRRYLLALLVLLAVLGFLLWQRMGPSLTVDSVTVAATPATLGCDGTEQITATLHTNGRSGTVHYHWVRSDGTDSGPLQQSAPAGMHQVQLPLRWTVQGKGEFQGTATVEITAPGSATAKASFVYTCA